MKKFLLIISPILGFFVPSLALAYMMDFDNYRWTSNMMGGFWPWIGGGMIVGLILWIAIIIGIVYLIKCLISGCQWGKLSDDDEAIKILKQRYAKGEIEKEEFEQKLKDLTKN